VTASLIVRLSPEDVANIADALATASRAADGDSNDQEITALQDCRDLLASITGLPAHPEERL
jgi:hypothetical protein